MSPRTAAHYDTHSRLTARQLEVMELISRATCTTRGALRDAMGLRSNNAVDNHLLSLEAKGLVKWQLGLVVLTPKGEQRLVEAKAAAVLANIHVDVPFPKEVAR